MDKICLSGSSVDFLSHEPNIVKIAYKLNSYTANFMAISRAKQYN